MSEPLYEIVRYFHPSQDRDLKVVQRNVSLEDAQRHCQDPKTKREGKYFDGYRRQS